MKNSPTIKVGLLGSGQLARMLALRAHSLGIQAYVYGGNDTDPAAQVTSNYWSGPLDDKAAIKDFLRRVDVVTFESEFMDADLLAELSKQTKTKIFPEPTQMKQLQDRWMQKGLLQTHKIPTSPFVKVSDADELEGAFRRYSKRGMVLKKRKFGYDGYGTYIVKSEKDLKPLQQVLLETPQGFIAEEFVKFKRELAFSAVRNTQGEIVFLPLVESLQKDSRCFWVRGPVGHPRFDALKTKVKRFLNELNYVGIIAFELFDLNTELSVNEIAPRVHNSAHYSLDALDRDQFQLHLEAVLGRRLKTPHLLKPGFAMVNLLGSGRTQPQWSDISAGKMHWYGKADNRKGRKMGHINCLAENPNKALKQALNALKEIQI